MDLLIVLFIVARVYCSLCLCTPCTIYITIIIGERYRLNHAIFVKLYHPYTQFSRNVCLSHLQTATVRRIVTFLIIAPYKYSFYLLIDQFRVDNYLWHFYGIP